MSISFMLSVPSQPSAATSGTASSRMQLYIRKEKKISHQLTPIRCCHNGNSNIEPNSITTKNNNNNRNRSGGGGGAAGSNSNSTHHNLIKRDVLTHGHATKQLMRVSDVVLHDNLQQQDQQKEIFTTTTSTAPGATVLKWLDTKLPLKSDHDDLVTQKSLCDPKEINQRAARIRSILRSIKEGEITASPYDTAWVALVRDVSGKPQFPSSLDWIAQNQLPDGSWGERDPFEAHDRILNTLACLIALKSWDLHPDKCAKAMDFLRKNLSKLGDEEEEHMLIGFEMAFPSLIEMGRGLGLEILDENKEDKFRRAIEDIYAKRELKLSRIPQGIMHSRATTLLHSLEGFAAGRNLDWEKLLKLQSKDGSFLFSPSSTAFALINTRDVNCLRYLNNIVNKFNGGVPNVYPIDLFERIWVVDRLQRLGICRFFQPEIRECMDYVYRHWNEKGICWATNSEVQDIDDTAMAFRLLRMHGYHVSPDVFHNFKKDGEFICFAGQSSQAVTGVFNMFRASQLQFQGEKILQEAGNFSCNYLSEKRASNQLIDKWVMNKDLPGEVGYALDMPWFASLPRVESRFYIEQYGADEDVWIGKTLYRVPYVNNNAYLELAKLDYNKCQAVHKLEWDSLIRWYTDNNLDEYGLSRISLLRVYFLAAASIYEPEKSNERLGWAKTSAMVQIISSYFGGLEKAIRERYTNEFLAGRRHTNEVGRGDSGCGQGPVGLLIDTLNQLSLDAVVAHGKNIHDLLDKAWERWLLTWQEEGDRYKREAELIAVSILLCSDSCCTCWYIEEENNNSSHKNDSNYCSYIEEENDNSSHKNGSYYCSCTQTICLNSHFHSLLDCTNRISYLLSPLLNEREECSRGGDGHHVDFTTNNDIHNTSIPADVELQMQKLAELTLLGDNYSPHTSIRSVFLAVAKSFYYLAYCTPATMDYHITKVMFDRVD